MSLRIKTVTLTPNPAIVRQSVKVVVDAEEISWNTIKTEVLSWGLLKNSFTSWGAVKSLSYKT